MKPLDQRRSIDAYKFNHTAKVQKKFVPHGSILEQLMIFADSVPDFRRGNKGNIRHRLGDIIVVTLQSRHRHAGKRAMR